MTEAAGTARRRGARLAAVDVGSNTIHVLVADVRDGGLRDVAFFTEMPELGAAVDSTGRIGPEKCAAALAALRSLLARAQEHDYEALVAGATAAVRRAADRDAFLERASGVTGVPVRLIDERREAELSFQGVASANAGRHRWVMVDVGGGSTELVAADGMRMLASVSLPVGSGRLARRHLSDPPRPEERGALRAAASGELGPAPPLDAERMVATGGTAMHLAQVVSPRRPATVLTAEALVAARDRLDEGPAAAVARRTGQSEARVRALRAGVEVLLLLLDRYGLDAMHVSIAGLRHGMILAYLERGDRWYLAD